MTTKPEERHKIAISEDSDKAGTGEEPGHVWISWEEDIDRAESSKNQAYINIGDSGCGTAIVTNKCIQLQYTERIPSGRAIAADFQSYRAVNVYSPSGHHGRQERHIFFE
jgi:exonuclease III